MPDFFSGLLNSVNNVVSQGTSIYTNVGNSIQNAMDTAANLGIIDNNGPFALPSAPNIFQSGGTYDGQQTWFTVNRREQSGGTSVANVLQNIGNNTTNVRTDSIIILPYPQQIQLSDNFDWSSESRSFLANIQGLDDKLGGSLMNAGQAALGKVSASIYGNTVSNELSFRKKEITNPHLAAMFKVVNLRQANFQFELVPQNKDDVNTIIDSINTIKKHAHPEIVNSNDGAVANKLKYPDEFAINIVSGQYSILKMENCVVTTIDTNYTPQQIFAAYEDGFPIAVQLNVSFMETVARDRTTFDTITRKS